MKNFRTIYFLVLSILILQSCKDKVEETFIGNVPIYLSYEELRKPVQFKSAQSIKEPGKIYIYGDYLFVVEWYKGVHVFNNSNPSAPTNIGFLEILGAVDIAVNQNTLFASCFKDLVSINISDPNNPQQISRTNDIFEYTYTTYGNFDPALPIGKVDEKKGVVINWKQEETTVLCIDNCHQGFVQNENFDGRRNFTSSFGDSPSISSDKMPSNISSGKGGSLARFAMANNHLYVVSLEDLHVVNISNPQSPFLISKVKLGKDIETIFPHESKLFIGSETSVMIYDISNASNPTKISSFTHVRACDPVVVQGNYAYATLRAGGPCPGSRSQLLVLDISDIYNPKLFKTYNMTEPYGLGIDGEALFICEGKHGLKVYNASNPNTITNNQIANFNDVHAFDVIPFNNVLIMTGNGGISQYDYSDKSNLQLLSVIPVN
jgi:hypothetical protein